MVHLNQLLILSLTLAANEAVHISVINAGAAGVLAAQGRDLGNSMAQVFTKAEIMASMTPDAAIQRFWQMNSTRKKPELLALVRKSWQFQPHADIHTGSSGGMHQSLAMLRGAANHSDPKDPKGYASVDHATDMLNEMGEEARSNLEVEEEKCGQEELSAKRTMEELRIAVSNFNAAAAGARARVIKAQGTIATVDINVRKETEALDAHKHECEKETSTLKYQLQVVKADIHVMAKVQQMIECTQEAPAPQEAALFMLLQCQHCNGIMLQHPVQQLLSALKSQVAKTFVQDSLEESFQESTAGGDPVALTQADVDSILSDQRLRFISRHGDPTPRPSAKTTPSTPTVAALNVTEVPEAPEPVDCMPTTKCTISATPRCRKLKDRFLVVQAGIVDKQFELETELREREQYCEVQTTTHTDQITGMQSELREEMASLAEGTVEQNQAESGSHLQSQARETAVQQHTRTMKECCDIQNNMKSDMCAIEKIRGELNNMEGTKVFVTDCEVSDWREEACSVSCAGGTARSTRGIITHPVGRGMACLPLVKEQGCNDFPCPINCALGDWSGWTECTAQCGGGVRERNRPTNTEARHGGEPCAETQEAETCGVGACNVDCTLSDWGEWSTCSKACGTGSKRRTKAVDVVAKGTGHCWGPDDSERLEFLPCNQESCKSLLGQINGESGKRTLLNCSSLVDVTVLLDGSGSLSRYGWWKSQELASTLITHLNNGAGNVQVALTLFSGPSNYPDYEACVKNASGVDMEKVCLITQVSHYTNDTVQLAQQVKSLTWPKGSTLTSVALGVAEAELKYGRPTASSVVVVITDGKPMSQYNTRQAAMRLQQKAKVIWVPVGKSAPFELVEELASKPEGDHVIAVRGGFTSLQAAHTFDDLVNKIISSTCPLVS